ncbi:MAG: TonB-dependent receptor [Bacteroidota bacterium]
MGLLRDTGANKYVKTTGSAILIGIALLFGTTVNAQVIKQFAGTVHNAGNKAITAATVYLLNSNFASTTDNNGGFSFKNIPAGKYSIQVSATGYATLVKTVNLNNTGTKIDFTLTEAGKQLEEVIVTAQKSDEQPQKLPLSLSAFSAQQVQDAKLWNSKDLTTLVPNLYSANPGDNRNVTSIRGITTTSYDPAVATYIDGVNQFGLDTYIAQLEDVERIEVLRGPQGTLYGRNAMGGVINIITKQPGNQTRGYAGIDYGNYNQQRYSLGLRTPLINNKLFFGVSGLFTKQDGFYTNSFTNTKFDNQHSFMGNYYLKYLATEKLSLTLNVKHVANRNNGAFPLASDPGTAISNPFVVNQNNTTTLIDNILNTSLSVKYTGNDFNFSSQSAYQSNYRYYNTPIDGDFSPIDGVAIVNNYGRDYNKVKVATQEFRFTSPASSTSDFKWVAGTYGFYESNPVKQSVHFGKDAALVGAPFPFFTSISTNKQSLYGSAIFGQVTYTINPKLDVIVGLRYDYEHNKQSVKGEFMPDGQPATVTQADTSSAANFKAFSPKMSLAYHVNDKSNLFAAYSRGFRTGGISQLGSDQSQPPLYAYNPESSDNFELGSKNTFWDNRIRLNATLFYTRVNNAQVPTLILPDAITVTRNAGRLESKGAELELAINPVKGLEADYNLGYTHARYKSLYVASNGAEVNLTGNHQVFTPDLTSVLALQYGYDMGSSSHTCKLIARAEWRYLGDTYFDLANQVKQNAYHLFNGRIGVTTKNLDVFFWEANLFNRHYIDYAYDFGAAHLGNPRTFGLSVRAKF